MNRFALLLLAACAHQGNQGDRSTVGGVLDLDDPMGSEASWMSARPLGLSRSDEIGTLQLGAHAVWHRDAEDALSLVAALQVDPCGTVPCVKPPADVMLALDVSDSLSPAEHPLHRVVTEVISDHLDAADSLGLVAFRNEAVTLVLPESDRSWALQAADALETLPELDALVSALPMLLSYAAVCEEDPASLIAQIEDCEAVLLSETETLPEWCGEAIADADLVQDSLDGLQILQTWQGADNPALYPGLCTLMNSPGTAIAPALQLALADLPDGTSSRASRLFLVSDLESEESDEDVIALVHEASQRFVGTTLMGVGDRHRAEQMSQAPGVLTLATEETGVAIGLLDERFDALLSPAAWGLQVSLATETDYWSIERIFGSDHPMGAATLFPTTATVPLLIDLTPLQSGAAEHAPHLTVRWWTPDGMEGDTVGVHLPLGARQAGHLSGDELTALTLVARRDLYDAATGEADVDHVLEGVEEIALSLEDHALAAEADALR